MAQKLKQEVSSKETVWICYRLRFALNS